MEATMEKESTFTTFSVRTDTENDALLVPDGIETVLVNDSAHRVIIPEGVEVVRLQTAKSSNHAAPRPPAVHHESTDTPHWLRQPAAADSRSRSRSRSSSSERTEPAEVAERVKREAVMAPLTAAPPRQRTAAAERSLSLPSVPDSPLASPDASEVSPPLAPLARDDEPDLFHEVPLRVAGAPAPEGRVVREQPGRNGSARPAHQPLMTADHKHATHGHAHARGVQPKWREQFQMEHEHSRPMTRQAGRACADVLCCWLGV